MLLHAIVVLVATGAALYLVRIELLAVLAALSFLILLAIERKARGDFRYLIEPANLVTGSRLLALLLLLGLQEYFTHAALAVTGLLILLADSLDGWLARRFQTVSDFGKYLDMETDALFVLALSLLLYTNGIVGGWIIAVGLLRYVYFISIKCLKPADQPESYNAIGHLIAFFLMGSLVAAFVVPTWLAVPLLLSASILVFLSFGRDFWVVLKSRV